MYPIWIQRTSLLLANLGRVDKRQTMKGGD